MSAGWVVERIVHFESGDLVKGGFVHFGFHDRDGRQYVLQHQKHYLGLVGSSDALEWTAAPSAVFEGVPNIEADISYPIYIDRLTDSTVVVSCFGNSQLYCIDTHRMEDKLLVDGKSLGMRHAGNCVVDGQGYIWVNEVDGCRIWRFGASGKPVLTLGDGTPGFQAGVSKFDEARFSWIYDIRKGPDGNINVLDSKNFAVRMIDLVKNQVMTLAGTGRGGYDGDGGEARLATFGSDPGAHFDGPISLSLDEVGNIFIGDRFNHVVRMIDCSTGMIETIAGRYEVDDDAGNVTSETAPLNVNLPKISSMDYYGGRLFVPTDLSGESGDLIVLRKRRVE